MRDEVAVIVQVNDLDRLDFVLDWIGHVEVLNEAGVPGK